MFANDLKNDGFKVVSIHPGFVITDMGSDASQRMSKVLPLHIQSSCYFLLLLIVQPVNALEYTCTTAGSRYYNKADVLVILMLQHLQMCHFCVDPERHTCTHTTEEATYHQV